MGNYQPDDFDTQIQCEEFYDEPIEFTGPLKKTKPKGYSKEQFMEALKNVIQKVVKDKTKKEYNGNRY